MTAQLIDGKKLAQEIQEKLKAQVTQLKEKNIIPGLAVILVGDNPASQVYVKNKVKSCTDMGIHSVLEHYPQNITEDELLSHINRLNHDHSIDGILVQLPLPFHINAQKVIEAISAAKDVDGFHVSNAGALLVGSEGFKPCTPYGCMKMLESIDYELTGKNAVVIGRSNIVGKPIAFMLLEKNATVTICHSKTNNLKAYTLNADVIISAVGRENTVKADMVKSGAVVIDVGINRNAQGKLCGDVDFEHVKEVAGWITPVPGGVGPMTITMLLSNTVESAQKRKTSLM